MLPMIQLVYQTPAIESRRIIIPKVSEELSDISWGNRLGVFGDGEVSNEIFTTHEIALYFQISGAHT